MRRPPQSLLVSAVTLAIALIAAELFASGTPEANAISFIPDDELLLVRKPSTDGWSFMQGRWVRVSINAFHMRDDEVPAEKAPEELRVLCLGDSFTYGGGCEQDQAWPQQAQALFGAPEVSGVRVLNGGANGWDTRFQRKYAEKYDADLLPDLIVLAWNWNDVAVSNFDEDDARHFVAGGFGSVLGVDVVDTPLVDSSLYRFLHQRLNGASKVPTLEATERRFANYTQAMHQRVLGPELEARGRDDWPGESAEVPEAWWRATDTPGFRHVREQLHLLAEHGRESGATVVVALMPEPTWPGPGPYPARGRLTAILDDLDLPWVDLMQDFLVAGEDGGTRRDPGLWQEYDFVHPNADGQRRIAEGVVAFLRERELLTPRSAD